MPQHQHQPLLTHNATINLLFLFFAIKGGMWQTCKMQQSICCFYFCPILEGGRGNDMVDCFYHHNTSTSHQPTVQQSPVVFIFFMEGLAPEGGRKQAINLLFLFFHSGRGK